MTNDETTMVPVGAGATTPGTALGCVGSGIRGRARAAGMAVRRRILLAVSGDAGMSTVEYAIGTLAAAAFGAVLYTVVSGDSIPDALGAVIQRALNTST